MIIIVSGCATVRESGSENGSGGRGKAVTIESLRSLNLTGSDFQIQKAIIKVTGEAGEQRLAVNLKFRAPETYLVSLRSLTGIEAARFYIADDTLLVNDRVNKRIYHGSTKYLTEKYGISVNYLPLIFGDIIIEKPESENVNCNENESRIIEKSENNDILYTINCSTGKVKYVKAENAISHKGFNINFDKFVKGDNISYYRNIEISDEPKQNTIQIAIERISRMVIDDLTFIPGKNYEEVILK